MKKYIYKSAIGAATIGVIQTLPLDEIIKAITQLTVAIITLYNIFKKKKGNEE